MKIRLITIWVAFVMLFTALTTQAISGNFAVGVTGSQTWLGTEGQETLKQTSVVSSTEVDVDVLVPSVFVQYEGEMGWALGFEYIPGSAELGARKTTRTDKLAGGDSTVTQDAKAELSNHWTIYLETPGVGVDGVGQNGFYAVGKYSQVTIKTNETLGTGAEYADANASGATLGVGFKRTVRDNLLVKLEGTHTVYEDISLNSTGSDDVSTITAESEAYAIRLTVGYRF